MSAPRNALGRGLGALIPTGSSAGAAIPPSSLRALRQEVAPPPNEIPVSLIDPNPEQPRRTFEPAQLAQLVDSIRRHGVLQPVVVRRSADRYELIVGERRLRAAQAAGLETIRAVVADAEPEDRLELAIVENVQRHDLNPIELAHAYRALAERGATQDEIGRKVCLDRSSVANHLRLLELSREMQEDVETGRLTMGHAKALLQVANPERRRHVRDRVLAEGLAVRDTEALARSVAGPARSRKPRREKAPEDPDLRALLDGLEQKLQTRVRLRGSSDRGRLEIEFFDRGDLDRVAGVILEA